MEEIPILGVIVGKGQVKMEQEKIKAVKEWKTPMKVKDIESFLRFANFYQCFIQNFSHTARPLNELKSKKEWKWDEEHQNAFKELKNKIISQPVLSLPKREEKFLSRNRCFRTCYRRSTIPGTRRKIETNSISIKDNATSRKEL